MKNKNIIWACIIFLIILLFFGNIFYGSVQIPASKVLDILCGKEVERTAWTNIVIQSRLPQAITALFTGAALAISGLMLQTLFLNPLAGPSILGISDGANLGVAIVMLYLGGSIGRISPSLSLGGNLSVIIAAFAGALLILMLIVYLSAKLKNNVMVLIVGMMIGYLASSGITLLNFLSSKDNVHSFVMWGMGNFSGVSLQQIPFFCITTGIGLLIAILLIKPLNTLLLGEKYATNLGTHIKRTRIIILLSTGLLTATSIAFCGPISFIGLAVPHMARLALRTSNQKVLVPATLFLGGIMALLCNLITTLPFGNGLLPLNAVTPVIGAPVIIYIIMSRKNIQNF